MALDQLLLHGIYLGSMNPTRPPKEVESSGEQLFQYITKLQPCHGGQHIHRNVSVIRLGPTWQQSPTLTWQHQKDNKRPVVANNRKTTH